LANGFGLKSSLSKNRETKDERYLNMMYLGEKGKEQKNGWKIPRTRNIMNLEFM